MYTPRVCACACVCVISSVVRLKIYNNLVERMADQFQSTSFSHISWRTVTLTFRDANNSSMPYMFSFDVGGFLVLVHRYLVLRYQQWSATTAFTRRTMATTCRRASGSATRWRWRVEVRRPLGQVQSERIDQTRRHWETERAATSDESWEYFEATYDVSEISWNQRTLGTSSQHVCWYV